MFYSERDLLRLLPRVLRARDFHLYLENGKRLTDLWLAGGRAVLGHKPPRVLGELKNAAERGLFSPLPHPMERRFLKALGELFPGRAFRIYAHPDTLQRAITEAGITLPVNWRLSDPAFSEKEDETSVDRIAEKTVSLWRPFISSKKDSPVFMPVLPWPLGPVVLVLGKNMDASFPAGEIIPPVLLAPATRALYDLLAAIKDGSRVRRVYPKVEKAIKGGPWQRCGIYLSMEMEADNEKYTDLFKRFLDGGFLIPPSPGDPLILPAEMSDGEETKLAGLLRDDLLT